MSAGTNSHILARDLFGIVLVLFIGLVAIMQVAKDADASNGDVGLPGNLQATITWPEGNIDVDLWVDGPGEPVPVGYSNKGGLLWNLLRDDLGTSPDASSLNFENAFARGIVPGDYRVNVHCYRCLQLPVVVDLNVALRAPPGVTPSVTTIATSKITLNRNHEEKTGLAFTIDADGKAVPASLNTIFAPLREAKSK